MSTVDTLIYISLYTSSSYDKRKFSLWVHREYTKMAKFDEFDGVFQFFLINNQIMLWIIQIGH